MPRGQVYSILVPKGLGLCKIDLLFNSSMQEELQTFDSAREYCTRQGSGRLEGVVISMVSVVTSDS